jgi:hypothetical protein
MGFTPAILLTGYFEAVSILPLQFLLRFAAMTVSS